MGGGEENGERRGMEEEDKDLKDEVEGDQRMMNGSTDRRQ